MVVLPFNFEHLKMEYECMYYARLILLNIIFNQPIVCINMM